MTDENGTEEVDLIEWGIANKSKLDSTLQAFITLVEKKINTKCDT